jgi:hypothetical protein
MTGEQGRYISYLLRLWQTEDEGKWLWRVSLEGLDAGERWGFADLEGLSAFLARETAAQETRPSDIKDSSDDAVR